MPIITCSHKRNPKSDRDAVALNSTDKGYCATKKLNYYGVKLHTLGLHRKVQLPFPTKIGITPASTHDLTALRPVLEITNAEAIFLDKTYCDKELAKKMAENDNYLLTPIKKIKGTPLITAQFDKAAVVGKSSIRIFVLFTVQRYFNPTLYKYVSSVTNRRLQRQKFANLFDFDKHIKIGYISFSGSFVTVNILKNMFLKWFIVAQYYFQKMVLMAKLPKFVRYS